MCKTCNEQFGRSIDNELASKLARFYSQLNTGEPAQQETLTSGHKKDGKIAWHDRFIVAVKKQQSFSGSPGYFRAIAKICLNYYLTKGYAKQYCDTIKAYIRGENTEPGLFYYAPGNSTIHDLAENEVSHIVHLFGNKESGVLYAYIELFNMQNLIIIFSMDYDGKDIDVTYCRDVITNEELSKKISLELTREQLEQLRETSAAMEIKLFPRFERLLQIIQQQKL